MYVEVENRSSGLIKVFVNFDTHTIKNTFEEETMISKLGCKFEITLSSLQKLQRENLFAVAY